MDDSIDPGANTDDVGAEPASGTGNGFVSASTTVSERIAALATRAERERASFEPPADPPVADRAMEYLRYGFGPTVWCYVDARTGSWTELSRDDFDRLDRGTNDWLAVYARCHGVDLDPDVSIRTAAETLLETRNVRDTAQLLTDVPSRHLD